MSEQSQTLNQNPQKLQPWGLRKHDAEILQMRCQGLTLAQIAKHFGTTRESIRNAVARQLLKKPVLAAEDAA